MLKEFLLNNSMSLNKISNLFTFSFLSFDRYYISMDLISKNIKVHIEYSHSPPLFSW